MKKWPARSLYDFGTISDGRFELSDSVSFYID
jgi:hypothetical protein